MKSEITNDSSTGCAGEAEVFSSEPLTAYSYDPQLARSESVILTVKTTLQLEKNVRQGETLKRPGQVVFGREVARPYVWGLVSAFSLSYDRIDWSLAESKWAFSIVEPYGIAIHCEKMALAGANYLRLIDMGRGDVRLREDSWLHQAHTVEFSTDGTRLLVGSAGFDAVFEFDTTTGEIVWRWFAWDHGFDRSKLGHYVVRSAERADRLTAAGEEALCIDDPAEYPFGLPTRQKPAHLNSALYDSDGNILVTLFHQGAGYVVDRATGEAREIISGLLNPHKLSKLKRGGYFVSDTSRGRVIFLDGNYRPRYEITLAGAPGVTREPELPEFLQNTTELRANLFACIDIHRSCLWLIDVERRKYRAVKFPVEWSVHDVESLGSEAQIGSLIGSQFGKVAAFATQMKTIHHFSVDGLEVAAMALKAQDRPIMYR
jgi:hypothetical protein